MRTEQATQLLLLYGSETKDWLMTLDNKRLAGKVLLDFRSSFDLIDDNLLLRKMQCSGFGLTASHWLQSYLDNRRQTVFFNGSFSDEKSVCCGVPQGSCLGSLLFFLYTNNFPLVKKKAKTAMYADDSTIYYLLKISWRTWDCIKGRRLVGMGFYFKHHFAML